MTRALRCLAAAAVAVGTAGAVPASATHDGGGTTCEMALRVSDDGHWASGDVWAGPWMSAEPLSTDEVLDGVTVTCTVQASPPHTAPDLATATASGTALAVLAPAQVTVPYIPGERLYLCTEITTTHDGVTTLYQYDADGDSSNGAQCAPGTRTVWGLGSMVTVLVPRPLYCFYYTPPGEEEKKLACVPCGEELGFCPIPPLPPPLPRIEGSRPLPPLPPRPE